MLNQAQKDFLESMIGPQGNIIETINEYNECPLSIKILYLKRSIQRVPETFLNDLDKLFSLDIDAKQIDKHIEFLVMLKTINDLCFNSPIQFIDDFEIPALEHYFSHLGTAIQPEYFKFVIQKEIHQRISELSYHQESDILLQMNLRTDIEANIIGHKGWRLFAHLTNEQLSSIEHHTVLHTRRHHFFSSPNSSDLSSSAFEPSEKLDPLLSKQLLNHLESFLILAKNHIKVQDLIPLSANERELILLRSDSLIKYLFITQTPLPQFLSLDYHQKSFLLDRFDEMQLLLEELVKLPYPLRQEFSDNLDAIYHLTYHSHIEFSIIIQLSEQLRQQFFIYYHEIHQLLSTQRVKIDELLHLNEPQRSFILSEASKIVQLISTLNIQYHVIQQLSLEQLELAAQNIEALIKLQPQIDSSEYLLKSPPQMARLIYSHIDNFIELLKQDISCEQLLELNIEQLDSLLTNPEQENIQFILSPSIGCCIL
jgi:hypothetical protein